MVLGTVDAYCGRGFKVVVVTSPAGETIPDPDSKTTKLMAPPGADFRKVYAAGRAIASLSFSDQNSEGHAAIAQGGTYDFQRDPKTHKFYFAYIHAANYAAGLYMSGAGYSWLSTVLLAKYYAFIHSSNYGKYDEEEWIRRGWSDGRSGVWR